MLQFILDVTDMEQKLEISHHDPIELLDYPTSSIFSKKYQKCEGLNEFPG
jgi:hypothetical protein